MKFGLRSSSGFSLLEFLVTVTVFSLLTALAVPNLLDLSNSFARANAVKQLSFDINRTKSEALGQGARAILAINGDSYTIGMDYLPYSSSGAADEILYRQVLPEHVTAESAQPVIFNPRGFLIDTSGSSTNTTISLTHRTEPYSALQVRAAGSINIEILD